MLLIDLISDPCNPLHGTEEGAHMGCMCKRCALVRAGEAGKESGPALSKLMASAAADSAVVHFALAGEGGGDRLVALP